MKIVWVSDDGMVSVIGECEGVEDLDRVIEEVFEGEELGEDWEKVEGEGYVGIDCGESGLYLSEDENVIVKLIDSWEDV